MEKKKQNFLPNLPELFVVETPFNHWNDQLDQQNT